MLSRNDGINDSKASQLNNYSNSFVKKLRKLRLLYIKVLVNNNLDYNENNTVFTLNAIRI